MQTTWIKPFHGRNSSGEYNLNFLWQRGNVYVMDNHRAALWCWFQHIGKTKQYNLFHIDRHFDTLSSQMESWLAQKPDMSSVALDQYLDWKYTSEFAKNGLLFRWDNYLSIFLKAYRKRWKKCVFATHGDGDRPAYRTIEHVSASELPVELAKIANSSEPWICNLDLDYFFFSPDDELEEHLPMFSNEYLCAVCDAISNAQSKGTICALTICLSPECCGSWEKAEFAMQTVSERLNLGFSLPNTNPDV